MRKLHLTAVFNILASKGVLILLLVSSILIQEIKQEHFYYKRQLYITEPIEVTITSTSPVTTSRPRRTVGWAYDYAYEYKGKSYNASSESYEDFEIYRVGDKVTALFDPEYPKVSKLPGVDRNDLGLFGPIAVSLLILVILGLIYSNNRKLETLAEGTIRVAHLEKYTGSNKLYLYFISSSPRNSRARYSKQVSRLRYKNRKSVRVISHKESHDRFYPIEYLPAKFDEETNTWKSSYLFVVLRLPFIALSLALMLLSPH